jgi:hypothetical protein
MTVTRESLVEYFGSLSDGDLIAEFRSGGLTDLGRSVAAEEISRRKLASDVIPESDTVPATDTDLVMVAQFLNPIDAEIFCSRLEADGVFAVVADVVMSAALGNVRVLVPRSQVARVKEITQAIRDRGPSRATDEQGSE